jgi:hypothetical protein
LDPQENGDKISVPIFFDFVDNNMVGIKALLFIAVIFSAHASISIGKA